MSYLSELLAQDEQIKVVAHRHILFLFVHTALYILGAIALWTLAGIAYAQLSTGKTILTLILLAASLIPIMIAIYRFMSWRLEQYAITSYRILQVEGIINKRTFDSSLEKVNDIQMTQGMFGRLFGYGNIDIITGSDVGINHLHGIAEPFVFKRTLLEAKLQLSDDDRPRRVVTGVSMASQSAAQQTTPPAAPQATATSGNEAARLMAALVDLRDSGVISAAEYEERRNQLLQQL
ncbi:MAG TPA: PH domain-containing protein [Thermomicrobiales bacterium]|nr:PH domain-containing protein [Thermomicrobiales bacterium]